MTRRQLISGLMLATVACSRSGVAVVATLTVAPSTLSFSARPGDVVAAKAVTLTDPSGKAKAWSASVNADWLLVTPQGGFTPSRVVVHVRTLGLGLGDHDGTIHFIEEGGAPGSFPASVDVAVHLTTVASGWSSPAGPWGGTILGLASDGLENGRVLAGDSFGTIWISDDGGRSFTPGQNLSNDNGEIDTIVMDPASGTAYATSRATGVWKSLDRGDSWTETAYTNRALQVALKANDPNVVFVLADTVIGSYDGGDSWRELEADASTCVATSGGRPEEAFACGHDVFQSTDAGQDWTALSNTCGFPFYVFRDPEPPQTLYAWYSSCGLTRSTDDLVSHTSISVPSYPLAMRRAGDQLLMAGPAGFFTSTDGIAWPSVPGADELPCPQFNDAAATGSVSLASHAVLGVVRAENRGLVSASGVFAHFVADVSPHPLTGDLLVVTDVHKGRGTRGLNWQNYPGLWRLERQVGSWLGVSAPTLAHVVAYGWSEYPRLRLARDPTVPDHLFLATCPGGLFESVDNGATWAANAAGLSACTHDVAFAPDSSSKVLVADGDYGASSVATSVDGGQTFSPTVTSIPGYSAAIVPFADGSLLYLYTCLGDNSAVLLDPGGAVLSTTRVGAGYATLATASGDVWLGTNGGIWRLSPGATTPELQLPLTGATVTSLAQTGTRLWAGFDSQGLRVTDDGGASWSAVTSPSQRVTTLTVDPLDQSLWVGTHDLGLLHFVP